MNEMNPYSSPETKLGVDPLTPSVVSWKRSMLSGAVWSILAAFPITVLLALFFRFPVPFAGIGGGISYVIPAIFGLLIYGIPLGGFILLGVCGALAGLLSRLATTSAVQQIQLQRGLSVVVTAILLFILATLDWYIGPW